MREMTVEVHDVAVDGLPDMDELSGRVAYVWDGCVVSGWPISGDCGGIVEGQQQWEPSEDRHGGPVIGVTHWIKLPVPAWQIASR